MDIDHTVRWQAEHLLRAALDSDPRFTKSNRELVIRLAADYAGALAVAEREPVSPPEFHEWITSYWQARGVPHEHRLPDPNDPRRTVSAYGTAIRVLEALMEAQIVPVAIAAD